MYENSSLVLDSGTGSAPIDPLGHDSGLTILGLSMSKYLVSVGRRYCPPMIRTLLSVRHSPCVRLPGSRHSLCDTPHLVSTYIRRFPAQLYGVRMFYPCRPSLGVRHFPCNARLFGVRHSHLFRPTVYLNPGRCRCQPWCPTIRPERHNFPHLFSFTFPILVKRSSS